MDESVQRTERREEKPGVDNFPIRLTWRRAGLVFLAFWFGAELLPAVSGLVGEWLLGTNPPGAMEGADRWVSARLLVSRFQIIHPFAIFISAMILYFGIARTRCPTERRRSRGEILTGILNLQILFLALGSTLVIPSIRESEPGLVVVSMAGDLLLGMVWCLAAYHLCEGRIFTGLAGVLLPLTLSSIFSWPLSVHTGYIRTNVAITVLGPVLGLCWLVFTLSRRDAGFEMFPTGLWPAVKKCGRVLIPIAVTFWLLDFGLADILFGFDVPRAGLIHYMVWGKGRSVSVLWTIYLAPLVFLNVRQEDFNRRTKYLVFTWTGVCILYVVFLFPLRVWAVHFHFERAFTATVPSIFGEFALGGVFTSVLYVFLPLCLLRWWVRGYSLRPLLAIPAGLFAAFGLSVVNTAAIAVIALPFLYFDPPPPAIPKTPSDDSDDDGAKSLSPPRTEAIDGSPDG